MDDVQARIDDLNVRLERTAAEVAAIRAELHRLRAPAPAPAPRREPRKIDLGWLTGARGMALAGGVVTLLGIVFVFALAASRGWIGPGVRCGIGAVVSALLVAASLEIKRRYGNFATALAAAGTGIGGGYVTLYAASRGYDLIGTPAVWVGVVVVAGAAVALSLAWRSQILAALGLVTVVVAPPIVEGELHGPGLGVSLVALAASLFLAQERRWRFLGGASLALTLVQVLGYVADQHDEPAHRGTAAVVTAALFALCIAGAAACQRRAGDRLDGFAAAVAGASLPASLVAVWALLAGNHDHTIGLLVITAAYVLGAAATARMRELTELLVALALLALALATSTALSNGGLAVAWALEGFTLVALAARLDRRRYQAAALAYFVASGIHVFSFETPLSHLFGEEAHPAQQIGALLLLTAGLGATALVLRRREQIVQHLDLGSGAVAALLALYAVSLGVMGLAQAVGGGTLHARFQRGETIVSSVWAIVALTLLATGLLRNVKELRLAGFALLGLALAKLFLFDLSQLSSLARAGSFLAVGLALLAGGFLVQRVAQSTGVGSKPA